MFQCKEFGPVVPGKKMVYQIRCEKNDLTQKKEQKKIIIKSRSKSIGAGNKQNIEPNETIDQLN